MLRTFGLSLTIAIAWCLSGCESVAPAVAFAPAAQPESDSIPLPPWAERGPGPEDFIEVYPPAAKRAGLESEVRLLSCTVLGDRTLNCATAWEEYPDRGFGDAALAVSRLFVLKKSDDPRVQPGQVLTLPIQFRLSE